MQGESDPLEIPRRRLGHGLTQEQKRNGVEVGPEMAELAGLRESGRDHLGNRSPDVVRPGHRGAVDVLVALGVPDERARGPGNDQARLTARRPPAEQRGPSVSQVIVSIASWHRRSSRYYFGFRQH